MRTRTELLGFGCALLLAAAAALAWTLLPKPGPPGDRTVRTWDAAPTTVEPLTAKAGETCSAAERLVLTKQRRVLGDTAGQGVAPVCKYVMHLEGWPESEDECVLEFPVQSIRALQARTLGSRLALTYYRHRQGGIMIFTGPAPDRSFISLDSRWCRWASVPTGIRALT
jgi:hypothetical protein